MVLWRLHLKLHLLVVVEGPILDRVERERNQTILEETVLIHGLRSIEHTPRRPVLLQILEFPSVLLLEHVRADEL